MKTENKKPLLVKSISMSEETYNELWNFSYNFFKESISKSIIAVFDYVNKNQKVKTDFLKYYQKQKEGAKWKKKIFLVMV